MHMTDRKIRKSALCITMSLVLTLCGCAAAAPASGQGSTGQEASGQGSTMQANAGQEVTGEATPGQEATGQEATAQEANGQEISAQTTVQEDEFDFEEGDQSTPAAEEMPSKFDLRDVQVKGSGIAHCGGGDQHSRQRAGAGRRLYSRDFQSVGEAPVVFCLHCAE